jgi:structural maintenance of chromosome 2
LYNVVVDNDKTGKLLLQKGELKRKVTIIPMNQIKPYVLNDNVINKAKDVGGNDCVFPALDLIDYDPQYRQVMEYTFGSRLICINMDIATKVAFHPQVHASCITLEGDDINPEGVLSGGSRGERANILVKLTEMMTTRTDLNRKREEFQKIDADILAERERATLYAKLEREVESRMNQMNLAYAELSQNQHQQKINQSEALKSEIERNEKSIEKANKELEELNQKLEECKQKELKGSDKEADKKKAQKTIEESNKFIEKHQKTQKQFKQEYDSIKLEVSVLNTEISGYNEEIAKIDENIDELKTKAESLNEKIQQCKLNEEEIEVKVNERRDIIKEKSRELHAKSSESDKLEKEKNSIELKIKELNHKKVNLNENLKESNHKLKHLAESNQWIEEEKSMFGKSNSVYDFEKQNIKEMQHRLSDIKIRKEKLAKQVDMRAMGLLAKKEEEYEELNKKRTIVLGDRQILESTIEDLEKIKMEVLKKAFSSINQDFGNIFKTLLPGAFARLEPCNRASLLEGVEFKIGFGDVWKDSLTELSGGQRSLVALSLILALLMYKPAPLYILDEVDAALDTSHTQNIGLMIKTYFKHSQVTLFF